MLPLLFAIVAFVFLFAGATAFLLCCALPPLRRFALSTALWWAMWGPCSIALMLAAGVALIASAFFSTEGRPVLLQHPHLLSTFGWSYLVMGALLSTVLASAVAWLHQFLIHRMTFALFRIYATIVAAGIGTVFGWSLAFWMLSRSVPYLWITSISLMALLMAVFGIAAYVGARGLRGRPPAKLTWVTHEEFMGS